MKNIAVVATISLLFVSSSVLGDVVLSEKIMGLALTAAELSNLAYEEDPPSGDFQHFGFYDEGTICLCCLNSFARIVNCEHARKAISLLSSRNPHLNRYCISIFPHRA